MEHLAIIMDGNGRWAKARGLPRSEGHRAGGETVRRVLGFCQTAGIKYLTLYAFSVENWKRPKAEVDALMTLLVSYLAGEEEMLHKHQVRLRIMGRLEDLPEFAREALQRVERATEAYERQLILCLSYGGRTEIAAAAKRLAERVAKGEIALEAIDEQLFAQHLYLPDVPDPDLVIRTSGELRVSNFLLWESAYSEYYFTDALWPDFSEKDLLDAVRSYSGRARRFGEVR